MPGRKTFEELVERFTDNERAYCPPHHNETQTRRESIAPFFEALGWDVNNRRGYSEAYKEVIHEEAIKVRRGVESIAPAEVA